MGQEKIIIAEDESRVAQALSRALSLPEGGGYQVETYESGEEALTRLGESKFDLLITDFRMPGMTGLELLDKCREISPSISSILITAFGSPQIEEAAYKLAVDAYLPKPFSMRSLVQTVQNTLKQKSRTAPAPRRTAFSEKDLQVVQRRMEELHEDVGARDVLLFDYAGRLFAKSGQQTGFDTGAFLSLLGNAMAATNAISSILDGQEAFDLHFHEGKQYDTYATRVNDQVFLAVVLDKQGNNSRIGMVWLYLRRAITDLRSLLANGEVKDNSASLGESTKRASGRSIPVTDEKDKIAKSLEDAIKAAESPPAPQPQPGVSVDDHNAVISYDQAKSLGLLNLDKK